MPARGDLDPVDLKALLPLLMLIDVVPDERRYVYRLVDTREVEMRGSDPTGKAIKDAYYGESAEESAWYLNHVVRTREPVLYRGTYRPLTTRTMRENVLFLPLSQDGQAVNTSWSSATSIGSRTRRGSSSASRPYIPQMTSNLMPCASGSWSE